MLTIAPAFLVGCTVNLDRCAQDDDCAAGEVCQLGGCVLGDAEADARPMDAGPTDARPIDEGLIDAIVDAAPLDMGDASVSIDMGTPLQVELIGPARLTELGDAEFQVARLRITGASPELELSLVVQADAPSPGCAPPQSSAVALRAVGGEEFEASVIGFDVPFDCQVDFETHVRADGRPDTPGPRLTIDNAPPPFDRAQTEIWPTINGHILVVDPADTAQVDFYDVDCVAPDRAPAAERVPPDPIGHEWTLAGPTRRGAIVLRDDRGNVRCADIEHGRPDATIVTVSHCLAETPTKVVLDDAATAVRSPCLSNATLVAEMGHHPVLEGECGPADQVCPTFVRQGPAGPDARYAIVALQARAEPVVHFTGPVAFSLGDGQAVSHVRLGDTLYVGTNDGVVARFAIAEDGRWTPMANLREGGGVSWLTTTVADGEPTLWIANHPGAARIQRCVGDDLACVEAGALTSGINQLVAAQLDDDDALEVVACSPDGLSIWGLDEDEFVDGPVLGPGARSGCRSIAAGRLRAGRLDSLVVTIDAVPPTVRRLDRVDGDWQFIDFDEVTTAEQPVIGDYDQDGLDALFVVHRDNDRPGRLRRVTAVGDVLAVQLEGDEVGHPERSVARGVISDVDQDGEPDLLAVELAGIERRLVYRTDAVHTTALLATRVHRVDAIHPDLIVYYRTQIKHLRPSAPDAEQRWPAQLPQTLRGRLALAGFDLNANGRDEFFFVGYSRDGSVQFAGLYEIDAAGNFQNIPTVPDLPSADYQVARADVNGDGRIDVALAGRVGEDVRLYLLQGGTTSPVVAQRYPSLGPAIVDDGEVAPHVVVDVSAALGEFYVQTTLVGRPQLNAVTVDGIRANSALDADTIGTVHRSTIINEGPNAFVRPFTIACRRGQDALLAQTLRALPGGALVAELPDAAQCQTLHVQRPSLPGLPLGVVSLSADPRALLVAVTDVDAEVPIALSDPFTMPSIAAAQSLDLYDFDGDLAPEIIAAVPSVPRAAGAVLVVDTARELRHRYAKENHAGVEGAGLLDAAQLTVQGGDFDADGRRDLLIYSVDGADTGTFYLYPQRD